MSAQDLELERHPEGLVPLGYALLVIPTCVVLGAWACLSLLAPSGPRQLEHGLAVGLAGAAAGATLGWLCVRALNAPPSGRLVPEALLSVVLAGPAALGPCALAWGVAHDPGVAAPSGLLIPLSFALPGSVASFLFVTVLAFRLRDPQAIARPRLGALCALVLEGGAAVFGIAVLVSGAWLLGLLITATAVLTAVGTLARLRARIEPEAPSQGET